MEQMYWLFAPLFDWDIYRSQLAASEKMCVIN